MGQNFNREGHCMYKSKQRYAIDCKNRERIKKLCPTIDNESGIYFYTRIDENGFKYAYIGQAVKLLDRQISHLSGFQHIDLSLKSHGLYDESKNPYGWKLNFLHYPKTSLDEMEQKYIKQYALNGYQLRNKTSGSQGEGKSKIDDYKPTKGYRDGLKQGYKNCVKDLKPLFDKHLEVRTKDNPPTRYQAAAVEKFNEIIYGEANDNG